MLIILFSGRISTLIKRRSSFQIAVDVLSVMNDGETKPTRIMYAANLSWKTLKSTLNLLETKRYIELTSSPSYKQKQFAITKEGLSVLSYYKRLSGLVKVDLPIQS